MARIHKDETSDFEMAKEDEKAFKIIGSMIRVFAYELHRNELFNNSDGPLYDPAVAFPPARNDFVARYLSRRPTEPAVGEPVRITDLGPIWKQVTLARDSTANELLLRQYDRVWDQHPLCVQLRKLMLNDQQQEEKKTFEPTAIQTLCRDHLIVTLEYTPLREWKTAGTITDRAQLAARDDAPAGKQRVKILRWLSTQKWLALPLGETSTSTRHWAECFDKVFTAYLGNHHVARFTALVGSRSTVLRFTLEREPDDSTLEAIPEARFDGLLQGVVTHLEQHVEAGKTNIDDSRAEGFEVSYTCHETYDQCQGKVSSRLHCRSPDLFNPVL